jgi:hypothetical protein
VSEEVADTTYICMEHKRIIIIIITTIIVIKPWHLNESCFDLPHIKGTDMISQPFFLPPFWKHMKTAAVMRPT